MPLRAASLVIVLVLAALATAVVAEAQPAGKVPRVGFLVMARNPGVEDAFPRGLHERGYVERRDVVIEWRSADGRADRLLALAAELVRLGVDVIVAGGPEARTAAMKATSTIPIVVVGGADPVAEGWASSLARPGGNTTGLTVTHPGLNAKKLEFLKEMIPGISRVAVVGPVSGSNPSTSGGLTALRSGGKSLGMDIKVIEVQRPDDFEGAFRRAIRDRRQALIVIETAMVFAHRAQIAEHARRNRLPIIGEWRPSAQAGFLVSYGADLGDLLRRAAIHVDKILKGARPGDLPVERPTKLDLVINMKTAKALGAHDPAVAPAAG